MAANNRGQYQGLLLPDVRMRQPSALWEAQSTYTEAGARPGRPVPARDTEALLIASGSQADGTDLDILAIDGGPVGRDPRAAGLVWKNQTDGANAYRGREIPATLSAWEVLSWQTGTGLRRPHSATLTQAAYTDRVVVVAEEFTADGYDVVSWYRAPDGTLSSKVVIHDATDEGTSRTPCLVEVGDRLFCLHWARGVGDASGNLYIRVQMSLDGGATWEVVRHRASTTKNVVANVTFSGTAGSNLEPRRLRAAYKDGQVLVIGHLWEQIATSDVNNADVWVQYASTDLSTRLDQILLTDSGGSAGDGGAFDLVVAGGRFVCLMAAANDVLRSAAIATAFTPMLTQMATTGTFSGVSGNSASPPRQSDADVALVVDDIGLLWGYVRLAETGNNDSQLINVIYSSDAGDTWERVGSSDATPGLGFTSLWNSGRTASAHNGDYYPRGFAVSWQRARAVMVHGWQADTGTNDNSLALAYIGGYHDLTIAPISDGAELIDRHPWAHTHLPLERAQDTTFWTATSAGVVANSLQSDGSEILSSGDGASAGNLYVSGSDSTTGDTILVATFAAYGSNSGASATTDRAAFTFRLDDGTRGVELGIYLSASAFGVYDRVAASQLAHVTGLANEIREWRLGMYVDEGDTVKRVRIWYRTWDTSEDRQWIHVGAYALASDGGSVGSNRVQFGCFTSGIPQADLEVYHGPHWTVGNAADASCLAGSAYTWDVWVTATDNPEHLSPTPMSSSPVYLSGGVSVRGIDGPAMKSDSWTLSPDHEFPVERVWPSYARSSRTRWRSTDDTAQVTIALAVDPELLGTTDSAVGSPLVGVWLGGINWRTGKIQRYTGAAWVDVASIDAADAFGTLGCTRTGATIVPSGDTTHQIAAQELVGWDYREIGPTGVVRRIQANRGGRWATGTTAGPRARLMLSKVDDTEATSTNAVLSARNVCLVFEHAAATAASGWRILIDAQDTVEGYFEIGTLMVGPVWVAGQPTDWGRRMDQVLGTAYRRQQDGSVTASHPAPGGVSVDVAFTGGVDTRQFHDGTTEPTWIETTSTSGVEGVATLAATVYDLQGEIAALGTHPVVYLPRIEANASGDVRTLTRWYDYLLGYVPDGVRVTSSIGDEGADESMTVGAFTIEAEQ
jgi:hypothetical protein